MHKILLSLLLCFFSFFSSLCEAKAPPQLTPHDTCIKIEEILKAHVSYQKLTPELMNRALQNYIEELDPTKTYFIEPELAPWLDPSPELLSSALERYEKEDFSMFEELYEVMIAAIFRRNVLEKDMDPALLPKNVQSSEFKDLTWAKSEEDLQVRLERIRALQLDTAEKLKSETRPQFLKRLNKRRINREEELITNSPKERKQLVLAYVLKAVSSSLDSQTVYFTPAEANQFMIQVQQRLFGIGAQLHDDLSGFKILRILEGGPAMTSEKLKVGDRIIAVDDEPVVGMDIVEAVELIRGQQGTTVKLTILRETGSEENKQEEKLDIEIIRAEVVLKETRLEKSYEPYGNGVIGHLHLFSFYQDPNSSSAGDLRDAILEMKKKHNLKGIILDLRNNAGGLLPQAVSVTGLFISKGVVVSVKDNTGLVQHLRNIDGQPLWTGPLIVLTNRTSASAAEIVAQTLQDYGRALVVGDPHTYGKGTFQTFTLESANYGKVNPKGEFKVTRGRYYTVSGKSPQLTGVQADIAIPGIFSALDIGEEFSKFPLANDQIPATFDDDLSDIPAIHRNQIMRVYKVNMQTRLDTYQPYLSTLRANCAERLELNASYQTFLKEIAKQDFSSDVVDYYSQTDLQLDETMNIMKDLILLMEISPAKAR